MPRKRAFPAGKIPEEICEQVEQIVEEFNEHEGLFEQEREYYVYFDGRYVFIDRRDTGDNDDEPICRLKFNGGMGNWDFALYKHTTDSYDDDELHPGFGHADGTIEGALRAGLAAYPLNDEMEDVVNAIVSGLSFPHVLGLTAVTLLSTHPFKTILLLILQLFFFVAGIYGIWKFFAG